jgi:phosphoribosylformimino-5-aminoimidazole carboxamide ribonucleotide (ProFAR) isomerase
VPATIDAGRRRGNRQQHTGQHVLSQAFERVLKAYTVSSRLGEFEGTIDLDRADLTWEDVERVEDAANAVVFDDRPVQSLIVQPAEISGYALRKPPKVDGPVRLIVVPEWDVSPCGGTHCTRTGEIGPIKVRRWEKWKGGVRVEFVCGVRALADYQDRTRALVDAALRHHTSDREVIDVLERGAQEKLALARQVKAAGRAARRRRGAVLGACGAEGPALGAVPRGRARSGGAQGARHRGDRARRAARHRGRGTPRARARHRAPARGAGPGPARACRAPARDRAGQGRRRARPLHAGRPRHGIPAQSLRRGPLPPERVNPLSRDRPAERPGRAARARPPRVRGHLRRRCRRRRARFAAAGARWLHVVDLNRAFGDSTSNLPHVRRVIEEASRQGHARAGRRRLRAAQDLEDVFTCGAARVVLGTVAAVDPRLMRELIENYGGRLAVAIDAKGGEVFVRGWTEGTGRGPTNLPLNLPRWTSEESCIPMWGATARSAGRTSEGATRLSRATGLPVIASGGVGNIGHVKAAAAAGVDGLVVGRALYEGHVDLEAAIAAAGEQEGT